MLTITASVGENSSNKPADVKGIQEGLNRIQTGQGGPNPKLDTDGLIGPKTVAAIKGFQTHNQLTINGRIDPNDATLAKLNELAGDNVPPPAPVSGIDWEFISAREGGQILKGYVPDPETSKSGVTIATGVDLGQRSESDIDNLDISDALKAKLKPYTGKIKQEAVQFLQANPLEILKPEADALDSSIKQTALNALVAAYNAATIGPQFGQLPPGIQTVIASVAFQYGNLASRTPNFWGMVTEQRWGDAIAELRNFGDAYASRRKLEADLLEASLN